MSQTYVIQWFNPDGSVLDPAESAGADLEEAFSGAEADTAADSFGGRKRFERVGDRLNVYAGDPEELFMYCRIWAVDEKDLDHQGYLKEAA